METDREGERCGDRGKKKKRRQPRKKKGFRTGEEEQRNEEGCWLAGGGSAGGCKWPVELLVLAGAVDVDDGGWCDLLPVEMG